MIHPEGSELDVVFVRIICESISFTKTTTVVHCDKLSFRLHEVIVTRTFANNFIFVKMACVNECFACTGSMF